MIEHGKLCCVIVGSMTLAESETVYALTMQSCTAHPADQASMAVDTCEEGLWQGPQDSQAALQTALQIQVLDESTVLERRC